MDENIKNLIDKEDIYRKAYKLWGYNAQMFMIFEEMAELQKAICKSIRQSNPDMVAIIEEIADVEIMLEQLQYIAMIPREQIEKQKEEKLFRLSRKMCAN